MRGTRGKSSDKEDPSPFEAASADHIALTIMSDGPTHLGLMREVPQSSTTLKHDMVHGNNVTVQGDQYFGSQGVNAEAEAENEEDVIIRCENIHKTYLLGVEGVPALRGVSLTIKRGEFVCIFGTSGGGKTTMLNVLGTIDKPTRGYLHICGVKVGSNTPDVELSNLRLNKLGFVFQTFNLLSALTALENVEMPMILAGRLTAAERRKRAKELLTAVGMEKRFDHVPSQMSGGEQQRVTIARSMANSPDILLLDEPTGDLDTANTMRVMSLLTRLNKEEGITLVLVTHDIGLKYFADRILWMRDGKLQRVEVVSASKRAEMYETLRRDVAALNVPSTAQTEAAAPSHAFARTAVRRPNHYECVRGIQAMERDLQRMDKSFLRKAETVGGHAAGEEQEVIVWDKEIV
jgi:putative ABC transport system ATP-binding protein